MVNQGTLAWQVRTPCRVNQGTRHGENDPLYRSSDHSRGIPRQFLFCDQNSQCSLDGIFLDLASCFFIFTVLSSFLNRCMVSSRSPSSLPIFFSPLSSRSLAALFPLWLSQQCACRPPPASLPCQKSGIFGIGIRVYEAFGG